MKGKAITETLFRQLLDEQVHGLHMENVNSTMDDTANSKKNESHEFVESREAVPHDGVISEDCLILCGRILRLMGDEVTCKACGKALRNFGDEIFGSYAAKNMMASLLKDFDTVEKQSRNSR